MKSRNTYQKELLNEEVGKFNSFFNAEDLFKKVIRRDKNIGIATVYRFLRDLTERRKIHSFICDRKTIYSIGRKNHCHFICEKCGKIEHIDINSLDFVKNKVNGAICHFQIDINGICNKCKV